LRLKIGIIGAGIVGKASGIGLESKGHDVAFADKNPARLDELKSSGHRVDSSVPDVARFSDIVMVSVPTPTVSGRTDLHALLSVAEEIGLGLTDSRGYKLVVVRSTVPPRTTRTRFIPALDDASGRRAGRDFGVCFNPEFLREDSALEDFLLPDRIVVGQLDQHSGTMLESLYEPFQKPVVRCTLEEAELAKYVANAFLATKISYFNEIHELCKALGVSSEIVSSIAALDGRIGRYGTVGGKPFKGSCLPKDVDAFLTFANDLDIRLDVLKAAVTVNQKEPLRQYA
jgi:UDPglucose 6-dehydrogenase